MKNDNNLHQNNRNIEVLYKHTYITHPLCPIYLLHTNLVFAAHLLAFCQGEL